MLVQDLMTTPVLTIRADKALVVVHEIMRWNHVRHVPVVSADGAVIGMVSQRDLLGASLSTIALNAQAVDRRQHLAMADVEKVMQKQVHTIRSDRTVQEAAAIMRTQKVGSLPVVDDGRLIGIITDADMVRLVENLPANALGALQRPLPRGGAGAAAA